MLLEKIGALKIVSIGLIVTAFFSCVFLVTNLNSNPPTDVSQVSDNRKPTGITPPPEVITWLGENRIFFFATAVNWGENWNKIRNIQIVCEDRPFLTPFSGSTVPFFRGGILIQNKIQTEVWGRNSNRFRVGLEPSVANVLVAPENQKYQLDPIRIPIDQYVQRENLTMKARLVGEDVILENENNQLDPSKIYYEKVFPQKLENVTVENWGDLNPVTLLTDPPQLSIDEAYTVTVKNYRDEAVEVGLHVGLYGEFQVREGLDKFSKQWWFYHSFGHYHEDNQVILWPGERNTITFILIPDSEHPLYFEPSPEVRVKIKVTGAGCESEKAGTIAKRSRILVENDDR